MSFPFHLWPLSAHLYQGRLHLGGHDLTSLARSLGTPLYLYDGASFDHAIAAYRHGLRVWPGASRVAYAGKAGLNLQIAHELRRQRLDLDVVSLGELEIALAGGMPPEHIHVHGNNKPRALLQRAAAIGVGGMVVDNLTELDWLIEMAPRITAPLRLWLRLNPDLWAPTHHYRQTGHAGSKFGLSLHEAHEAATRIGRHPGLRLTGLHTHIGSHIFALDPLQQAFARLTELAADLRAAGHAALSFVCPGGGLGVPYTLDDPHVDVAAAVAHLAQACAAVWTQRHSGDFPTLVLEPGRSLIARAGIALYTVGVVRHLADGSRIVAVDGSMADNPRPALYGARYTAALAAAPQAPSAGSARIVGPICESGDILIEAIELPVVQSGDILAVPVAGAYHLSMASNYNASLLPAVHWLTAGALRPIQRRQTVADLLARDLVVGDS